MDADRRHEHPAASVEEQAIACFECGASDLVRSDEARAVKWPAWEPGPHENFCPSCGGTCWAAEPREAESFAHAARYPDPSHPTLRGRLERLIAPGVGYCFRCGRPWRGEIAHYTRYNDSASCFPLCESCWSSLTPRERWPYYERLVDMWVGQMPEEAGEYEKKRSLIREAVSNGA